MSMTSPTRGAASTPPTAPRPVLVWDLPVRVFHWLMVVCFVGAYLTAESERWQTVHVTLGYTMAALVAFRLVWGAVGTRYARFADFVRGPAAIGAYLRSLVQGRPQHFLGHNPAGGLAILALLGLGAVVTATGWATLYDVGGEWWEDVHEGAANLMLGLVVVHIAAVVVSSRLHREHLVAAMIHGKKMGTPEQGIRRPWRLLGALLLAAVVGCWWRQWSSPLPASAGGDQAVSAPRDRQHGND